MWPRALQVRAVRERIGPMKGTLSVTYTCTVAWCRFDGRSMAALRRHIRQCHPWIIARELKEAKR